MTPGEWIIIVSIVVGVLIAWITALVSTNNALKKENKTALEQKIDDGFSKIEAMLRSYERRLRGQEQAHEGLLSRLEGQGCISGPHAVFQPSRPLPRCKVDEDSTEPSEPPVLRRALNHG